MRLTCPNCGAQYEVPDEVIPNEGRDVQCSNCGDTWYQAHPDHADTAPEPEVERQISKPAAPEQADAPQPARDDAPGDHDSPDDTSADDTTPDDTPPEATPEYPASSQQYQEIDAGISGILREEAEREARLRAADPLEIQPDLGLDSMTDDEPGQRARESRSRMARMRGDTDKGPGADDAGSRRDLLPDIEEISSTLRSSDDDDPAHTALGPAHADQSPKKRGGFARGFALVVIVGLIMALVYLNAPKIAKAVPQVDPMLNAYVAWVDQARIWLDARLGEFTPKPGE